MIYDVFHILLKIKELYPELEISSLSLQELEYLLKNTDIPESSVASSVLFSSKNT